MTRHLSPLVALLLLAPAADAAYIEIESAPSDGSGITLAADGSLSGTFALGHIKGVGTARNAGLTMLPTGTITFSLGQVHAGGSLATDYSYAPGGSIIVTATLPGDSAPETILSGTFGSTLVYPEATGFYISTSGLAFSGAMSSSLAAMFGSTILASNPFGPASLNFTMDTSNHITSGGFRVQPAATPLTPAPEPASALLAALGLLLARRMIRP